MIEFINNFNFLIMILFTLLYMYQFIFMIIGIVKKPKKFKSTRKYKYAIIIPARNEEVVIGNLIDSIKYQRYPKELLDIYVIADNCTDKTADIAKSCGAYVYERFNQKKIGKGYALDEFFQYIDQQYGYNYYDAYVFFDSDNILDENFIINMNAVFDNGYEIVTGYRNSKNFGASWVASSTGTWFLRDCVFMNKPRMILGTTSNVTGTGFMVSSDIIKENNGWKYHLLTEDIQFSIDMVLKGKKIGYAHNAIFYDEQPIKFRDSWKQRLRWVKGFYQVLGSYGNKLVQKSFIDGDFGCYDMLMLLAPGNAFTLVSIGVNIVFFIIGLFDLAVTGEVLRATTGSVIKLVMNFYIICFVIGLVTTITQYNRIDASFIRKIINILLFPVFMISYILLSVVAFFKKVKWEPIKHNDTKDIKDINKSYK